MKVEWVEVEVHEKRAHPHEMGHYDCSARAHAVVERDDGVEWLKNIEDLIGGLRVYVSGECDRWELLENADREIRCIKTSIEGLRDYQSHRLQEFHDDICKRIGDLPALVKPIRDDLFHSAGAALAHADERVAYSIEHGPFREEECDDGEVPF